MPCLRRAALHGSQTIPIPGLVSISQILPRLPRAPGDRRQTTSAQVADGIFAKVRIFEAAAGRMFRVVDEPETIGDALTLARYTAQTRTLELDGPPERLAPQRALVGSS